MGRESQQRGHSANTYSVMIYREVDNRGTAQEHILKNFYEFTVVESFPRTTHKVVSVALILFKHVVNEVIYETFAMTKKPQRTSSVRTTKKTS